VLTVDFDRLAVRPGSRVLDLGCGGGRHAFAAWRRGGVVVALDRSEGELKDARAVVGGMLAAGELADGAPGGVVNGDALALPLMAWDIGPGDAVFCPSFTFAATPEVIPWTGATPVFIDILPDTYNIDPAHLEAAIEAVKAKGELRPAAVIAVDLFGQPADYPRLAEICRRHGLKLIAGQWAQRHLHLFGVGQEIRILQRRGESRSQLGDPVRRQAGRGGQRAADFFGLRE